MRCIRATMCSRIVMPRFWQVEFRLGGGGIKHDGGVRAKRVAAAIEVALRTAVLVHNMAPDLRALDWEIDSVRVTSPLPC